MFGKRAREAEQMLTTIERQVDRIHTALIVRDPGSTLSVDAYEGLRKQVIAAASARLQYVAQLAEFDVALRRGANVEDLATLVEGWLVQAGIETVVDPSVAGAWEVDVADNGTAEVALPAYVDTVTGRLVRQGRLRPTSSPRNSESLNADEAHGKASHGGVDSEPGKPADAVEGDSTAAETEAEHKNRME